MFAAISATFTTGKRRAGSPSESGSTVLAPSECDRPRHGGDDACPRCHAAASRSLVAAATAARRAADARRRSPERQPARARWQRDGSSAGEAPVHRHEEEMNVEPQDPTSSPEPERKADGKAPQRFGWRNVGVFLGLLLVNYLVVSLLFSAVGESSRRDPVSTDVHRAAPRRKRRDDHCEGPGDRGHVREGRAVSRRGRDRHDELLDRGARVRGSGGARPTGAGAAASRSPQNRRCARRRCG